MSAGDGSPSEGPIVEERLRDARNGVEDGYPKAEDTRSSSLKRKQETVEETTSKRAKVDEIGENDAPTDESRRKEPLDMVEGERNGRSLDDDRPARREAPREDSSEETRRPSVSGPERQKGFSREERKRGQRLFGGLLSTLSQTTANSQQKKRLEIEKRQQERAHQQKIEDDKRRADRLAKLDEIRRIEQVKFDERVMNTRHSNLLAMARCFQTEKEPKLCYLPWDLTEGQEQKIKDQVRDAEDFIAKEVQDFKRDKDRRLRALGVATHSEDASGEASIERSNAPQAEPANPPSVKYAPDKDHDERDIMVETEEDTVLY